MGLKKLKWLKFLYIGYNEAQAEQEYWDTKLENHNIGDHGEGIVSGVGVTATDPASLTVVIPAGRLIDADGNDIVVSSQTQLDLTSHVPGVGQGTIIVYIIAKFNEQDTDNYYVSETGTYQFKYSEDTVSIQATQSPSGIYVELARIALTVGAMSISNPADPVTPGTDEVDRRYIDEIVIPGWITLRPATNYNDLVVRLASLVKGAKYLLLPGTWVLSTDLDIDQDDVIIKASPGVRIVGTAGASLTVSGSRSQLIDVHTVLRTSSLSDVDVMSVDEGLVLNEMHSNLARVRMLANEEALTLQDILGNIVLFDTQIAGVRETPTKAIRLVNRRTTALFTDADWRNFLESGTPAAVATWYAVYLIGSSSDPVGYEPQLLLSRSFAGLYDYDAAETTPQNPTLPSNYDVFRRIGSVRTLDADATKLFPMMKEGQDVSYLHERDKQTLVYNTWTTYDFADDVPPGVRAVRWICFTRMTGAAFQGIGTFYVSVGHADIDYANNSIILAGGTAHDDTSGRFSEFHFPVSPTGYIAVKTWKVGYGTSPTGELYVGGYKEEL